MAPNKAKHKCKKKKSTDEHEYMTVLMVVLQRVKNCQNRLKHIRIKATKICPLKMVRGEWDKLGSNIAL